MCCLGPATGLLVVRAAGPPPPVAHSGRRRDPGPGCSRSQARTSSAKEGEESTHPTSAPATRQQMTPEGTSTKAASQQSGAGPWHICTYARVLHADSPRQRKHLPHAYRLLGRLCCEPHLRHHSRLDAAVLLLCESGCKQVSFLIPNPHVLVLEVAQPPDHQIPLQRCRPPAASRSDPALADCELCACIACLSGWLAVRAFETCGLQGESRTPCGLPTPRHYERAHYVGCLPPEAL